ncbi:uncharacterized protein V2V93DRAFT_362330 [Kockiozyma suomiensis]|uniref:uncharacterized protein n=1 Tax=Kockiozyma suomiensis TaxID=1337062 RepID=UPI003343CED2
MLTPPQHNSPQYRYESDSALSAVHPQKLVHSGTPLMVPATPPSNGLSSVARRANTPPHLSLSHDQRDQSPHVQQPSSHSLESLIAVNQTLRTRVSELELVNDLFRSRISELESNEATARKSELTRREIEAQLQRKLEESSRKGMELQSRLEELEIERSRQQQQQQQQQHPLNHLLHLPLPHTPASPALDGVPDTIEGQHLRKKMRVSELVGGGPEAHIRSPIMNGVSATPPLIPISSSRNSTPHMPSIMSPQTSSSLHSHHIPPLQLSPILNSQNSNSNNSAPRSGNEVNGTNGSMPRIPSMILPPVTSMTLPPTTAPAESG